MSDIVKTLRFELRDYQGGKFETAEVHCRLIDTAAYTIETLRAEVSRLTERNATLRKQLENAREALRQWEEWETKWIEDARCWVTNDGSHIPQDMFDEYVCGPQNAREALKGQPC